MSNQFLPIRVKEFLLMRLKMFKMDMVMMKMECLMLLISLMIMKMTIIYRKEVAI